jgi:hypothetical protein
MTERMMMRFRSSQKYFFNGLLTVVVITIASSCSAIGGPPSYDSVDAPQFWESRELEQQDWATGAELDQYFGVTLQDTHYEVWLAKRVYRWHYVWIFEGGRTRQSAGFQTEREARDACFLALLRFGLDRGVIATRFERKEVPPAADDYYFVDRLRDFEEAADVAMVYELLHPDFVTEIRSVIGTF